MNFPPRTIRFDADAVAFPILPRALGWTTLEKRNRPASPDVFHHLHFCTGGTEIWKGPMKSLRLRTGRAGLAPARCPIRTVIPKSFTHAYFVFSLPPGSHALVEEGDPIDLGAFDVEALEEVWRAGPESPSGLLGLLTLSTTLLLPRLRVLPEKDRLLERIREFHPAIEEALRRGITARDHVTSFASVEGVEANTLSQGFRRRFGTGLKAYLSKALNERACVLLLSDRGPLRHLAEELGFRNEYHFNAFFTRMNGRPPSHWRREKEFLIG